MLGIEGSASFRQVVTPRRASPVTTSLTVLKSGGRIFRFLSSTVAESGTRFKTVRPESADRM